MSKLDVGLPSMKLKFPPNSCIPRRANIKIKRKSRSRSERIEDIAFVRATTRLRREDQYLEAHCVAVSNAELGNGNILT